MKRIAVAWFLMITAVAPLHAGDEMLELVGRSLGTTYSVKIFAPPPSKLKPAAQLQLEVDALQRDAGDENVAQYLGAFERAVEFPTGNDEQELFRANVTQNLGRFEVALQQLRRQRDDLVRCLVTER